MADDDDGGLLAIDVSTDDYAETVASDAPSVPRTFQSEENWQAQKSSYTAKIDQGNIYAELVGSIPILDPSVGAHVQAQEKVKLSKRELQLLEYAAGEMYFDKKYVEVIGLVERVKEKCVVDEKMAITLTRWRARCEARMARGG